MQNEANVGLLNSKPKNFKNNSVQVHDDTEMKEMNDRPQYVTLDEDNNCKYCICIFKCQEIQKLQKFNRPPQPENQESSIILSDVSMQRPNINQMLPQQILQSQQQLPTQPQQIQQQQQQQKQQMVVICTCCYAQQVVQDEKSQFQCFRCRTIILPVWNIFQCGSCFSKVIYQQGISSYVRCSKCQTSNYLPQQPPQHPGSNNMWNRPIQFNNQMLNQNEMRPPPPQQEIAIDATQTEYVTMLQKKNITYFNKVKENDEL